MQTNVKISLTGSERDVLPGARWIGRADRDAVCQVNIICRRPDRRAFGERLSRAMGVSTNGSLTEASSDIMPATTSLPAAEPLSREQYATQFGASAEDFQVIRVFAAQSNLRIVREDACSRTIVLAGTTAQLERAFDVQLHRFGCDGTQYQGYTGPVHLPEPVAAVVTAVLGLDTRVQASPSFRLRPPLQGLAPRAGTKAFTPLELAALYDFPDGDGSGQCIAILELGGGFDRGDLQTYFAALGVSPPQVVAVSVDGAQNNPSQDPASPDGEVMLDIEIAGALAPAARIAVYFAPNSDAGFIDALNSAIHDTANRPSVVSISWGKPEAYWSVQALRAFNDALQAAASMGITVCVASGDDGSSDGIYDGSDHVDFPASSPFSLACGGTRLIAEDGHIAQEAVWNNGRGAGAGGGGVSTYFGLPAWQNGLQVRFRNGRRAQLNARGVPDVAGVGDPETGYIVRIHGEMTVIGGTSAVSPLWAGLIARINGTSGKPLGFLHPLLYRNASACRDVTQGNNGDFAASTGWDACTGFGSPDGKRVAQLLAHTAPSARVTAPFEHL